MKKLLEMHAHVERHKFKLALTESHFTMRGRNRCDLNSAWATGVAYARFLNLHQRHGVMPLGKVMTLYRKHTGRQSACVTGTAPELDVVASRTDGQFFLHAPHPRAIVPARGRRLHAGIGQGV